MSIFAYAENARIGPEGNLFRAFDVDPDDQANECVVVTDVPSEYTFCKRDPYDWCFDAPFGYGGTVSVVNL